MKSDKAWPEFNQEKKNDDLVDTQVFPKHLVESTVQKSLDSLLNETFEDPEEVKKPNYEVETHKIKKHQKVKVSKKRREFDPDSQFKYLWITVAVLFVLSFYTLNNILCKLKIIESLISRQS